MTQYRTQNRKLAAKVETTPGTDASPTMASNAFVAINPQMPGGPGTIDNSAEITGSVDTGAPIIGGGGAGFTCQARLKGSGAAGTTVPEIDPLLRACGLQSAALATTHSGTATAATTSSITLAAGASSVADAYVGMPLRITSGAASGDVRVVTAYNGTTKVATVFPNFSASPGSTPGYSIDANHVYTPRATGFETVSLYDYLIRNSGNVRLRKLIGAAGTMTLSLVTRDIPTASFSLAGKFVTPTDVSDPGAPTLQSTVPPPAMGGYAGFGSASLRAKPTSLDLDLGNAVVSADDPSDEYGIDVAGIVRRQMSGSIVLPQELLSVRDVWTDFLGGTEQKLFWTWGSTAGNRVSIYAPRCRYTGREDRDVQGYMYEGLPFSLLGGASGLYMCFW